MLKLNQASWSSLRKIHRAFESVRVVLSLRFKGGTESSVEFIRLSIIKIETARFAHFGRNIRETIVVTREAQNADKPTSRWEGACLVFIFCFTSAEDARTAITSIATTRLNDQFHENEYEGLLPLRERFRAADSRTRNIRIDDVSSALCTTVLLLASEPMIHPGETVNRRLGNLVNVAASMKFGLTQQVRMRAETVYVLNGKRFYLRLCNESVSRASVNN